MAFVRELLYFDSNGVFLLFIVLILGALSWKSDTTPKSAETKYVHLQIEALFIFLDRKSSIT